MTDAERGIYIQLLAMSWLHGSLSFSHALAITFARDESAVRQVLESKFTLGADGMWFNERLEEERVKQSARAENGRKGAGKRWDDSKQDGKPHGKHGGKVDGKPHGESMHSVSVSDSITDSDSDSVSGGLGAVASEDPENTDKIEIHVKPSRFAPPAVEDIRAYMLEMGYPDDSERLWDFYTANGWVQGKNKPIKDWKAVVRNWQRSEFRAAARGSVSHGTKAMGLQW